jgi:hypothetical protein
LQRGASATRARHATCSIRGGCPGGENNGHIKESSMKRIRHVPTLLACLVLWGMAPPGAAQVPSTGSVLVRVEDARGAAVAEVLVTITGVRSGWSVQRETSGGGVLDLHGVRVGEYTLMLERLGYQPKRIGPVWVRAGEETRVSTVLSAVAEAPRELTEEQPEGAVLARARPGSSRWLGAALTDLLPAPAHDPAGLITAVTAAADLSLQGLPVDQSAFSLDGVRFRPLVRRSERPLSGFALAREAGASLDVVLQGVDTEWGGATAGYFGIFPETGAPGTRVSVRGAWAGDPVSASSIDEGAYEEMHGAFDLSGAVGGGRGRYTIGAAFHRVDEPLSALGAGSAELTTAAAARGVDLSPFGATQHARGEALNGFGRAQWRFNDTHELELGGRFAALPAELHLDAQSGQVLSREGRDFAGSAVLRSRVSPTLSNVLRLSATRTERERDTTALPFTRFIEEGLTTGSRDRHATRSEAVSTLSNAITGRGPRHEVKAGVELARMEHDFAFDDETVREFAFGGAAQLAAGTGFVRETLYRSGEALASHTFAAFVQDRWRVARGLQVQLGVRVDGMLLPSDGPTQDEEWLRLTGIANDEVTTLDPLISPRVGVTWDVGESGRWLLHATAGMHSGRIDPQVLSDWHADDGNVVVTRTLGTVEWPGPSPSGFSATRLTLLARDFALPRTGRVTLGAARRIDAHTLLGISGVLRRTERLARRFDLNLLPLPAYFDQHGRGVFGTPAKQGALLVATPGSNRRFDSYDEVAAITSDGWSDHWGVTLAGERDVASGVGVFASYTFSRTTDNWVGAADGVASVVTAAGLAGTEAWDEGRSDFDRPHRLAAGVALLLGPARIAGTYRLESGAPFTPAFRPGVDVNADGSDTNDPAFIADDIDGMDAVLSAWPCVRESLNTFAERNACRAAATSALDLSAGVTLGMLSGLRAALSIDALDVLDSWRARPDAALYLIDPVADLVIDEAGRTVALPLIVNDSFGEEAASRKPGRKLRIGISLTW